MNRHLLPPSGDASARPRTWAPHGVPRTIADFHYVVVDEIVGSSVGLALSAWPQLDGQGRLLFGTTDAYLVGSPRGELETFLSEHRLPEDLRERPLRIGDVFAVRVRPEALAEIVDELDEQQRLEPFFAPGSWIEPPVYDVTADAREAAKVAFYAAVTPTLDAEEAEPLAELLEER
ncbi:MAG: hypothetical protein M3546_04475 [Actinomycetota bacterium]|nr:hypothetical protein [Actinomycetota bacterium]